MKTNSATQVGLGNHLRAARQSMGLRQSDLAEKIGIPNSHLSDIERGATTPTLPTLRKIGEALNRPLEYFLQDDIYRPRSLGMVIADYSIGGRAAIKFAELVEERTNGEMRLRLYQRASLGTAYEQVEALREGAIHIYIDEPLSFELYAELCGPVFLPFFFQDRQQYQRFLQSDIFKEHIEQPLLDNDIRLLNPVSNWECGSFEILFSNKPIFSPEDLIGAKYRSYPSQAAIELRRALKAEPVVVEWAEAYDAFEQGEIDAFMAPAAYFLSTQVSQIAKYATKIEYGYTLNPMVAINDREFLKLSPDIQNILIQAAQDAGEYCTQIAEEQSQIDIQKLNDEFNLPVIHPDLKIWRAAYSNAIQQICHEKFLTPELFEALKSL